MDYLFNRIADGFFNQSKWVTVSSQTFRCHKGGYSQVRYQKERLFHIKIIYLVNITIRFVLKWERQTLARPCHKLYALILTIATKSLVLLDVSINDLRGRAVEILSYEDWGRRLEFRLGQTIKYQFSPLIKTK